MEEKKSKNVGLIIVIIILLLVCIGMIGFIFINKDKLTAPKNTTTITNENKNVEDKVTKCDKINYDLDTNQYSLSANAVGISVVVDNTKKFNSYGKLNGISDIISLVPAEAQGYHTDLARKVDGTVIDLADTLKATGNFN